MFYQINLDPVKSISKMHRKIKMCFEFRLQENLSEEAHINMNDDIISPAAIHNLLPITNQILLDSS